ITCERKYTLHIGAFPDQYERTGNFLEAIGNSSYKRNCVIIETRKPNVSAGRLHDAEFQRERLSLEREYRNMIGWGSRCQGLESEVQDLLVYDGVLQPDQKERLGKFLALTPEPKPSPITRIWSSIKAANTAAIKAGNQCIKKAVPLIA